MRACAASLLLATGCIASASSPEPGVPALELGPAPPSFARAPVVPAIPAAIPDTASGRITIAFGGDVHGESSIAHALARGENPLAGVAAPLRAADLALVNLETTVGKGGVAQPRRFVFRAPVSLLDALADTGVDVVSLANNHAWDYGKKGVLATLVHVRNAGLVAVGAGTDDRRAYAPAIFDVRGTSVAVIGVSRVGTDWRTRAGEDRPGSADGFDIARTTAAIRAAAAAHELVVVTVHMGAERHDCPTAIDREFVAHALAAGASIVVGHHPHVLQGVELTDGKLAAYSVGNLVFDAHDERARTTGVLTVTAEPDGRVVDYAWAPARIEGDLPVLLDEPARSDALARIDALGPTGDRCRGWSVQSQRSHESGRRRFAAR